jgi:uncharacterized cupin superfamily protein
MQRVIIHLIVTALLLAGAFPAFAQRATKSYSGTYNGAACTVQMTWQNWAGLGPVEGRIRLANGATIPFSGSNSRTGVLDLTVNGAAIRLVRRDVGRRTSWVSPTLSFTEGAPTPTPTPTPGPSPAAETEDSSLVDQTYTGTWNGKPVTAQIRWAPGDTPEVLRRGRGKVTMEDGTQVSIEASQPSADAVEFNLKPDAGDGETHNATKATSEGTPAWESSSLTLIEKK